MDEFCAKSISQKEVPKCRLYSKMMLKSYHTLNIVELLGVHQLKCTVVRPTFYHFPNKDVAGNHVKCFAEIIAFIYQASYNFHMIYQTLTKE